MTTLKILTAMAIALLVGAIVVYAIFVILEAATRPNYSIMLQHRPAGPYRLTVATEEAMGR